MKDHALLGWVRIEGADGNSVGATNPLPVALSGSTLAEQLTQADAAVGVLTFSDDLEYIEIYNTDTSNAGVFAVNGIDINVPADEVWSGRVGGTAGATVTITGATTYIVSRMT